MVTVEAAPDGLNRVIRVFACKVDGDLAGTHNRLLARPRNYLLDSNIIVFADEFLDPVDGDALLVLDQVFDHIFGQRQVTEKG